MKLSTRKVIGLASSVFVATLATLWVPSGVLRSYLQVAILGLGLAASVFLMGWASIRTNNRLVATLVILAAIVWQIVLFLLLGLKLGFVHNVYQWNLSGIVQVFLPAFLLIVGAEVLRGQLVEKGKGSLLAVLYTGLALWLIMVLIALPAYNLAEHQAIFTVLTTVVGPLLLTNILTTYIAYTYDYRINLGYRLVMELPAYLLPILPDAGVFLPALFQIGLIALLTLALAGLHRTNAPKTLAAMTRRQQPKRLATDQQRRLKRTVKWVSLGIVAVGATVYVALMSGLFKYYFLAIGSGSMEPSLYRGDLILVEKSKAYDELEVGDVLIYRHSNAIMVHRITEISQEGNHYIYQTKGDHNASPDTWRVEQGDVIGLARGRIATFGYPTLWLNELFNQDPAL